MKLPGLKIAALALTGLLLQPGPASCQETGAQRAADAWSLTLFGGLMTDNDWTDFFTPDDIDFGDSVLVGIAAAHEFWLLDDRASLAIEGQVVRHSGDQDHWEFNLPLVGRWHALPWDAWLDTSIALGIGPSYATETPRVEVLQEGSSKRWMVYWLAEIEAGLPSSPWRGMIRLHHRSGAYGVVADEGGSNVLIIGLRRYW